MRVNPRESVRFLTSAYEPEDWVAVFLKSYTTGRVAQRIRSIAAAQGQRFQAWLRAESAAGANVYVSVNAVAPHQRSRRREAIAAIRHVFLDADRSSSKVINAIERRRDLPRPSYVLRSSPRKAHIFWRVTGFASEAAEGLQKQLARELGTDPAATACTQLTRLPGFLNHKYPTFTGCHH